MWTKSQNINLQFHKKLENTLERIHMYSMNYPHNELLFGPDLRHGHGTCALWGSEVGHGPGHDPPALIQSLQATRNESLMSRMIFQYFDSLF